MTRTLILGLAAAAIAVPASAQYAANDWRYSGWRTVGYKTVNGRDTDTVNLPGYTRQRAVRVCALNAPLRLRDFDIRFANGRRQDVNTRDVLRAGTCTRAVDLRGNRRDVEQVRLRYEPIARGWKRPLVRIQVR